MSAETISETLQLERKFGANVTRVFSAWTEPEVLAKWFGPEGFSVFDAVMECRPGGKYCITIEAPDKTKIKHFGEYLEVDAPNKLIFTWELENQACQGSASQCATTIVELSFIEHEGGTLLKLQHEKLPNKAAIDGHRFGWTSSFESLTQLLAN